MFGLVDIILMNNKQLEFLKIVIDYHININKTYERTGFMIYTLDNGKEFENYGINTCGGKSLFTQIEKVLAELQ